MLEFSDIAAGARATRSARGMSGNLPAWRYEDAIERDCAASFRGRFTACQTARGFLVAVPLSAMLWGLIAVSLVQIF